MPCDLVPLAAELISSPPRTSAWDQIVRDDWDANDEAWVPETRSVELPGLTWSIYAMELETRAEEQSERFAARVLGELSEIKRLMPARGRPKSAKSSKGVCAKPTIDQRLEELHHTAMEVAEERSLRDLGKMFGCSPSAFLGGEYYKTKLKPERDKFRAKRAMERARGPERGRAENRQARREKREHEDSYETIDDRIDATWDDRQGGRHKRC